MILGTYKREYPRGYVMRGWDPQNPTTLSKALPVETDSTGAPEDIQPGMIITTNSTGDKWVCGIAATAASSVTSAVKNSVSVAQDGIERWDVMASDSLVGLSCAGKFRIATPFFARYKKGTATTAAGATTAHAAVYTAGTPLTYCLADETEYAFTATHKTTGALVAKSRSLKGFIRPAASGEQVIGIVAETHSGKNRAAAYPASSTDANLNQAINGLALQESIGKAVDSTSKFTNAYMVIWDTQLETVNA